MDALEINKVFHDHESAYYDERFAIVHDDRSGRRARREIERWLGRPLRAADVVVDAGCGTGWYAAGLRRGVAGSTVVGADLSTGMLSKARAAGAWPLVQADAARLPFADGSADVIVARGVLHHLPDVETALADWRRVLRADGAAVLTSEPTPIVEEHGTVLVRGLLAGLRRPLPPDEDFWEVASMAANLHVFTPDQIGALATRAGFGSVRLATAGFAATLVLTASYVVHGRAPGIARRLPWRSAESAGRLLDAAVLDRVLPAGWRHTVVGVLRR